MLSDKDQDYVDAIHAIARALENLGNAGATSPSGSTFGAIEYHGMQLKEGLYTIASAIENGLHEIAQAIESDKD